MVSDVTNLNCGAGPNRQKEPVDLDHWHAIADALGDAYFEQSGKRFDQDGIAISFLVNAVYEITQPLGKAGA